jgi:hypothetical protein
LSCGIGERLGDGVTGTGGGVGQSYQRGGSRLISHTVFLIQSYWADTREYTAHRVYNKYIIQNNRNNVETSTSKERRHSYNHIAVGNSEGGGGALTSGEGRIRASQSPRHEAHKNVVDSARVVPPYDQRTSGIALCSLYVIPTTQKRGIPEELNDRTTISNNNNNNKNNKRGGDE